MLELEKNLVASALLQQKSEIGTYWVSEKSRIVTKNLKSDNCEQNTFVNNVARNIKIDYFNKKLCAHK